MWSWLFSSSGSNDDLFINAVKDNLIDTENIKKILYRASEKKYFDRNLYPIPKMVYSPVWFSLNEEDVIFYIKNHDAKLSSIMSIEYNFKPNYKILNLQREDRRLNREIMKILVDHVISKIENDNIKKQNISNKIKENDSVKNLLYDEVSGNILSDENIVSVVLNEFRGIYKDERTNYKLIDELLFQEIINEMMRLNLVERYNIVGFWNGFSLIKFRDDDVIPEEIVIIGNRMRECLEPINNLMNNSNDELISEEKINIKRRTVGQTQEEKIQGNIKSKQSKRNKKMSELRSSNIIGGKKYKKNKNKKRKTKTRKTRKYKK